MSTRVPKPCGTDAAYVRHLKHNETPCDDCKAAHAEWARARREPKPRVLKPCGTVAAYARHRKNGEEPCQPCKEAMRAKNRAFRTENNYHAVRSRALLVLARRHPEEWTAVLAEELATPPADEAA